MDKNDFGLMTEEDIKLSSVAIKENTEIVDASMSAEVPAAAAIPAAAAAV